ncbi:hypothetical protein C4D60_Mb03t04040 [Musa balbisiana]|uniref:Uncharacterized protein n=1 Tax=Musa balbisiana TaxID=52838 RepID=A0A4V4H5V0_MUSBA|nr:hypothetical protein C4D60_Mb03t04040 [Musa balbisiana]
MFSTGILNPPPDWSRWWPSQGERVVVVAVRWRLHERIRASRESVAAAREEDDRLKYQPPW